MSYHDLSECTLSPEERREEATRIIAILIEDDIEFTTKETQFIEGVGETTVPISVKQLFWLRDIKDKYL